MAQSTQIQKTRWNGTGLQAAINGRHGSNIWNRNYAITIINLFTSTYHITDSAVFASETDKFLHIFRSAFRNALKQK